MSVLRPIQYPADKVGRLVHDGVIPPPKIDFNFAKTRNLRHVGGPALTYTGNGGTSLVWDENATLVSTTDNQPRFDHDPVTSAALGLLIEEARTNEALWNRDLTNAAWVKSSTTALKDAVGLDGSVNSASTLTATGANGTCLQTVTKASAANTYSVWVKRKTGTGNIDITDNNGVNWTTLTGLSSTAWTRHDITRTQSNPLFGIRIVTSGDEVEVDFNQLEAGSARTSVIATTTVTITRAADVCSTTDVSWFNESGGTFYVKAHQASDTSAVSTVFDANDNSGANRIVFQRRADAAHRFFVVSASAAVAILDVAAIWAADTTVNMAGAYAVNDFEHYVDGSRVGTGDQAGAVSTGINTLNIGSNRDEAIQFNGHIARIMYWDDRLSNDVLQLITA